MKRLQIFPLLMAISVFSYLTADDLSLVPENGWGSESVKSNPQKRGKQTKEPKQRDLFLMDVGAVYLKPYQGGTDFAQVTNTADQGTNQQTYGTNKGLGFNFDWGFRASAGCEFAKSQQTINLTYLYFASDAHKTTTTDYVGLPTSNQEVISTVVQGSHRFFLPLNSANSHWNLHFNMLDLTFGKKYPKKGCMSFHPFIGLKGIQLSENQKSTFTETPGANPLKLEQKIDFKGAGVMGGLTLDWAFTKWLSFIGSVDGALLYSSVETKRKSNNVLPTLVWLGSSHDVRGTSVLEGLLALKGVYCWESGRYIDLKVGFEEHYIFETMKHTVFNSDSSTDLSLMGWFATLGFGF